jgi:hypothetical protein
MTGSPRDVVGIRPELFGRVDLTNAAEEKNINVP